MFSKQPIEVKSKRIKIEGTTREELNKKLNELLKELKTKYGKSNVIYEMNKFVPIRNEVGTIIKYSIESTFIVYEQIIKETKAPHKDDEGR